MNDENVIDGLSTKGTIDVISMTALPVLLVLGVRYPGTWLEVLGNLVSSFYYGTWYQLYIQVMELKEMIGGPQQHATWRAKKWC